MASRAKRKAQRAGLADVQRPMPKPIHYRAEVVPTLETATAAERSFLVRPPVSEALKAYRHARMLGAPAIEDEVDPVEAMRAIAQHGGTPGTTSRAAYEAYLGGPPAITLTAGERLRLEDYDAIPAGTSDTPGASSYAAQKHLRDLLVDEQGEGHDLSYMTPEQGESLRFRNSWGEGDPGTPAEKLADHQRTMLAHLNIAAGSVIVVPPRSGRRFVQEAIAAYSAIMTSKITPEMDAESQATVAALAIDVFPDKCDQISEAAFNALPQLESGPRVITLDALKKMMMGALVAGAKVGCVATMVVREKEA